MTRKKQKSKQTLSKLDRVKLDARGIKTIEDFKEWTRTSIRAVFPHEALICIYGHIHSLGIGIDYTAAIDCPAAYLQSIRNKAGGSDSPILRRWFVTREPMLFEIEDPWPDIPTAWLKNFRAFGLKNLVAHGVYDNERCIVSGYSFYRIPQRLHSDHAQLVKQLVPIMHAALHGVLALLSPDSTFTVRLAKLSPRKQEIVRWIGVGKTNSEIARICGLSENTVKHYLTRIFSDLGIQTRTQLASRLAEHNAKSVSAWPGKIL